MATDAAIVGDRAVASPVGSGFMVIDIERVEVRAVVTYATQTSDFLCLV